jgi:hypothetical protein
MDMERMSDRTSASFDLADIVLADRAQREQSRTSPARVRSMLRERLPDRRSTSRPGYDATSVAILALVVLAVAVILGFAVSALRAPEQELPAARPSDAASAPSVVAKPGPTRRAVAPAATVAKRVAGVQLAPGRITAKPVGDGSGAVIIHARVSDVGTKLPSASRPVMVAVVLDGEIVGVSPLTLAATPASTGTSGAATLSFRTDSCSSGTHSLSVIVDSTAVVAEADEQDNARSTQLAWNC